MLLDSKEKVVESFIENFLVGTINVDFYKLIKESGTTNSDIESFGDIVSDIRKWYVLHTNSGNPELQKYTEKLFQLYTNGRALGVITGVLKEISQLEYDLEECKQHNILLAQDGKEKERIIATYEARMYEKK